MPTVEDVARRAVAAVGVDTSYRLVCDWVNERYHELANRVTQMRHLRRQGQVYVPAPITAGLVSPTQGSTVVTGDATAQAAWSNDIRSRHIRISITWYKIVEYSQSRIILDAPYAETTAANISYSIVQRFTALDAQARHFGSFTHPRRRGPVTLVPYQWLEETFANRQNAGPSPQWVCEVAPGLNEQGQQVKMVELYPYSSLPEVYNYLYWVAPPQLEPSDELPQGIEESVMKDGALIDIMRYEMGKSLRAGQMEAAAIWRNDYRAQRSVWEDRIRETLRADRGPDDAMSMAELPDPQGQGYIPSAHTMVYDNWPR